MQCQGQVVSPRIPLDKYAGGNISQSTNNPYLGWCGMQEGQGLGKSRQGIVAPLVAQKTAARSGVIVVGKEQQPTNGHQDKRARVGPALQVGWHNMLHHILQGWLP